MNTNVPQQVEYSNRLILTSQQLAELYGTDENRIKKNFNYNKDLYVRGRDYFFLEGEDLKEFKNLVRNSDLVDKRAPGLYLWTERGAFHHSRHLHTKKAMEVYDMLISSYFKLRELQEATTPTPIMYPGYTNSLLIERMQLFNKNNTIAYNQFCIFQEVAFPFYSAELKGFTLPERAVPDISVGTLWRKYAEFELLLNMSLVEKYKHQYPDHRGERDSYLYPIEWLPAFRVWFHTIYLPIHFPAYLKNSLKKSNDEIKHILIAFKANQQIGR